MAKTTRPHDVQAWLDSAIADAERRRLPELRPLLEALAQSLAVLRAADWNADASRENGPGAFPPNDGFVC